MMRIFGIALLVTGAALVFSPSAAAWNCVEQVYCESHGYPCDAYWVQDPDHNIEAGYGDCISIGEHCYWVHVIVVIDYYSPVVCVHF